MIASNLRRQRKAMNLTQQKFADKIGVSVGSIVRWESGRGEPDEESLEKLTSFLAVSAGELQKRDPFPFPKQKRGVLDSFSFSGEKVKAMKYSGRDMDKDLLNKHPEDFSLCYCDGFPTLTVKALRVNPFSGDWIVFNEEGTAVRAVVKEWDFKKRYKKLF